MPNVLNSIPIDINTLFSRGRIEIPKYQRSYSWTDREVTEFLEDLYGAVNHSESWFLGIIYTYNTQLDSPGHRGTSSILLDGQQRMTTLFIFLKELMLYHEVVPDPDVAEKIKHFASASLTNLVFETATDSPRLVLDDSNRNEFSVYLKGDSQETANFQFFSSGAFAKSHELINGSILKVRSWLIDRLRDSKGLRDEFEYFKRLVKFVLYEIELIEISLDTTASFHNIFENINDRGRRLTGSDKFKNRYCSLIPKTHIGDFESDWFEVSKAIYSLKGDLDDDLFDFYFRSIGENDLDDAGSFYGKVRLDLHKLEGTDKGRYVSDVWVRIKEMVKVLQCVETLQLNKVYHGAPGNNVFTSSKLVNVLVREAWRKFSQLGVLVYALYFNFNNRSDSDSFKGFLTDLLNATRFYLAAHLSGEGANAIRPFTIEIAKRLSNGETFTQILDSDGGRLDFASRLNFTTIDDAYVSDNKLSKLLLMLVQASVNRELIEHYDADQNWTLEHLLPISWAANWPSAGTTDWAALRATFSGSLVRQVSEADLNAINKNWIQDLLGNKFVISWKQNNTIKNSSLHDKQEHIRGLQNAVMMPTVNGSNILDYKTFGVSEICERSQVIADRLKTYLQSRDLE